MQNLLFYLHYFFVIHILIFVALLIKNVGQNNDKFCHYGRFKKLVYREDISDHFWIHRQLNCFTHQILRLRHTVYGFQIIPFPPSLCILCSQTTVTSLEFCYMKISSTFKYVHIILRENYNSLRYNIFTYVICVESASVFHMISK
jgi:hypothetical protein